MQVSICMLTTVHPPFDNRIFHKQATTLAQAGYRVSLVARHHRPEQVNNVTLIPLSSPSNRLSRMFGLTWKAFRLALAQRVSVYHFHDPELLPVGLLLKLLTRSKVIYDIHEDYPKQILSKTWIPPWLRRPLAWMVNFLEKAAAYSLDALVVATPSIAQRFPPHKTVLVRNFPCLREFPDKLPPYHPRPPHIVYIGGISRIRGAREMVLAMQYLRPPATLQLAGVFQPPTLLQELQSVMGWHRVQYLGWLSRQQIPALLSKARVGLLLFLPEPNHIHALPNKLFEYMAAGIPFVASDFPLWRELGRDAGLFVDPQNPKEIAQAIQWLLDHPDQAQVMGQRGRQLVEQEYNWERESQKLLTLYQRLLT